MADFEPAEINAFIQQFPQSTVQGCFFQLFQCFGDKYNKQNNKNDAGKALNLHTTTTIASFGIHLAI